MMKSYLSALLGAALLSTGFTAGAAPSANVYSPYKGVLCDKKAGFCADEQGISMGLTREYLGAAAEAKMLKLVNEGMTTTAYVTSNGVDCDHTRKVCMAERRGTEVERRYTKQLFGG